MNNINENKNERIISALNKLDPSEQIEQEIFDNIKLKQAINKTSRPRRILYKPAAVIAAMLCLVMAVSATALIINRQYVPFMGFVEDGGYEIYYTPEILKLGQHATIETVTRVKDNGISELSIIITDTLEQNIKIITEKHGEFDLIPINDYRYSSFGTMGKFQFDNAGDYSSYGYYVWDFPDINEFKIISGGESAEVKLASSDSGGVVIAEDSGVSMKFYNMSKGSKVLAYQITDSNFDLIQDVPSENFRYMLPKTVELGSWTNAYNLYDKDGKQINLNGVAHGRGPGASQIMFLRIGRDERLSRVEINNIIVNMDMWPIGTTIFFDDKPVSIGSAEGSGYIPVPADGEELIFDDGLIIYDANGLVSRLKSVKRDGSELLIYTDTEYNGSDFKNYENVEHIYMWFTGLHGLRMSGPGFQSLTINGDEDYIKVWPTTLRYSINGNWEILFD